ncbi:hypothetical protein [Lysobacter sp. Hz 25]|uniref:hypothetical protein n=1 Tax=Lysobacter sp. Hz 25 TaxID=3383698 RepID=UPI0038D4C89F
MRKWIFLTYFLTTPAWAQEQCEAFLAADPNLQMQFIPHLAAPPNAYVGISYNSESLVQVQANDISGRKAKIVKKNGQETCDCFKMITDNCRTIYVPANKGTFTVLDAYKRGLLFVIPEKNDEISTRADRACFPGEQVVQPIVVAG